ncbi:hypothetical protein D9758_009357 [Tetrapyrgos nigripes]|uniref:Uncharacterized protein n=1 Tax=Tetrapyrgos nigripes TaxID=182062 RepID=A0A8H5GH29_9AGAR|nr:hypothetical protein D9758_009357 [Tetrapyrgos nigripes]
MVAATVPLAEEARSLNEDEPLSKRGPHIYEIIEDESLAKRDPHRYSLFEEELAASKRASHIYGLDKREALHKRSDPHTYTADRGVKSLSTADTAPFSSLPRPLTCSLSKLCQRREGSCHEYTATGQTDVPQAINVLGYPFFTLGESLKDLKLEALIHQTAKEYDGGITVCDQ